LPVTVAFQLLVITEPSVYFQVADQPVMGDEVLLVTRTPAVKPWLHSFRMMWLQVRPVIALLELLDWLELELLDWLELLLVLEDELDVVERLNQFRFIKKPLPPVNVNRIV
jgi:hypothetical protein